jgi:hypothetical protein
MRSRLGGCLGASLVIGATLVAACGRDPNTADNSPDYDPRAITRCEHGANDDQQTYTVQQWRACLYAARAFADNPPVQLRYARKSCDLGFDEGCIAYLDFVRATAARHDEAAREHVDYARTIGKKLCEEGLRDFAWRELRTGEACHLAGLLFHEVAPADDETATRMFAKGCSKGDEGSCTWMKSHP